MCDLYQRLAIGLIIRSYTPSWFRAYRSLPARGKAHRAIAAVAVHVRICVCAFPVSQLGVKGSYVYVPVTKCTYTPRAVCGVILCPPCRRARDAKSRELFERVFPELRSRREQQERFNR